MKKFIGLIVFVTLALVLVACAPEIVPETVPTPSPTPTPEHSPMPTPYPEPSPEPSPVDLNLTFDTVPQGTIAAGEEHTVGLRADGTVVAVGNNVNHIGIEDGRLDVGDWSDIIAISAGGFHTVGLRADGTVVADGRFRFGENPWVWEATGEISAWEDDRLAVDDWTDIIAISAGSQHTVGLRADGTVVAVGSNISFDGSYIAFHDSRLDVDDWTDIVAISAGVEHTVGLRADGTVVAVGNSFQYIRSQVRALDFLGISYYEHEILERGFCDCGADECEEFETVHIRFNDGRLSVDDWSDIVAISAGKFFTVGLKADGTVVVAGSPLGGSVDVSDWTNIVAIDASNLQAYGLKADGTIISTYGYIYPPPPDVSDWSDIIAFSVGAHGVHIVGLRADGTVIASGQNYVIFDYMPVVTGQINVEDWTNIRTTR